MTVLTWLFAALSVGFRCPGAAAGSSKGNRKSRKTRPVYLRSQAGGSGRATLPAPRPGIETTAPRETVMNATATTRAALNKLAVLQDDPWTIISPF
ncbi:hypothetical protein ACIRYZ_32125 [Kitasatospora sp. NPDC101155]|uniref:hypothetical protein n=1 Tax=Kitasatospora sp. NPDC101155 TaxID=3364097 RepID=UPI003816D6BC